MNLNRCGVALVLLASGCAADPYAVPGKTLLNGVRADLRDRLATSIAGNAATLGGCQPRVLDTRVVQPPDQVQVDRAEHTRQIEWRERWTFTGCGPQSTYSVNFVAASGGEVSFSTAPESGVALESRIRIVKPK